MYMYNVCPFVIMKNIAKITVQTFYFCTNDFRAITRLNTTGPFVSDLFGNHEDRFCHDAAQFFVS